MIYSFMFPRDRGEQTPGPRDGETALLPLAGAPWPSCAGLLDQLDGAAEHASQHVNLAVSKVPPRGAVTAWLRQGLRAGMCPLCRVAHKADRE